MVPEEKCSHCENIKQTAEGFLLALHMIQWPMKDVAQLIAYIHARIKFHGMQNETEAEVQQFVDFFNRMCEVQLQDLQFANPIEPKSFDEGYDFRAQMKNGE